MLDSVTIPALVSAFVLLAAFALLIVSLRSGGVRFWGEPRDLRAELRVLAILVVFALHFSLDLIGDVRSHGASAYPTELIVRGGVIGALSLGTVALVLRSLRLWWSSRAA